MYSPVQATKKYFIIDECHRMSPTAADAMLKLIEEPPAHVRFILCTTDIQKLRPAIMSRCQVLEFRKIYYTKLSEKLKTICQNEGLEAEYEILILCTRPARVRMRNAKQNLQKLISFSRSTGNTGKNAHSLFGTAGESVLYDLLDECSGS